MACHALGLRSGSFTIDDEVAPSWLSPRYGNRGQGSTCPLEYAGQPGHDDRALYLSDDVDAPVGRRYDARDGGLRDEDPALHPGGVREAHRPGGVPAGRGD